MKTSVKVIHWAQRIICILAILFISIFAADAFAPGLSIWQQLKDFAINLLPDFVLLAIILIAWKWELTGGIIFLIIGVVASPFTFRIKNVYEKHNGKKKRNNSSFCSPGCPDPSGYDLRINPDASGSL
jgi:hypothetical protein